jgi:DNA-binding response OmpR family regulator
MIIEDNLEVKSFVNDLLSDSYKTIIFDDGQQALNYLEVSKNGPPIIDLILSDINMPNLDGYELAKILKEDKKWSTIPLIMLTAKTEEQDKIQALRLGVDDYICKPFSPIELKLRISNALDNYNKRKVYQKELHEVNFDFEKTISADQQWLKDLEENAKEALNKEINLTAGFLSSTMAIGERQLARKVKLLTGMTVGKYIVEVKLQKARHLLESKAFNSVAEVSFQCGFSSPSYFAKIYRENFGKNPSTYLSSHS